MVGTNLERLRAAVGLEYRKPRFFQQCFAECDDRRFVVGAPRDSARATAGGTVYGYDFPLPTVELGAEIPRPSGWSGLAPRSISSLTMSASARMTA